VYTNEYNYIIRTHFMLNEQTFAIIKTSGSQFKVKDGCFIFVDRVQHDVGAIFELEPIYVFTQGQELLTKPMIHCEVISHLRGKKVKIIKFRRRKHSLKRQGFRADLSKIRVAFSTVS
jgi:large subunit ribosomal protein L21